MKNLLLLLLLSFVSLNAQIEIKNYEVKNIKANNRHSNYGAAFYGQDKIVFSSSEKGSMYDLYIGEIIDENVGVHKLFSKGTDTHTHQASVAFTNDLKTVYFTQSIYGKDHVKVKKQKRASIAIYKASISSTGVWENITPLPFNSKKYDVGHPTLNADNTKLYFSSNMPGTIGKSDIFVVDILTDNNYSEPKNLGNTVNTKGNEYFPFFSNEHLYYSSNGFKSAYGGLDIYSVKITNNTISNPVHLPTPINSMYNDFSFIYSANKKFGFFSSSRPKGKGGDDIYYFKEKEINEEVISNHCLQKVTGIMHLYASPKTLANVEVILKNEDNKIINKMITSDSGRYSFDINCNSNYSITVSKSNYTTITKKLVTYDKSKTYQIDFYLQNKQNEKTIIPKRKLKTGEIGFNYNESILYKRYTFQLDKAIILLIDNPKLKIKIESHTDSRAADDYNMQLSEDRIFRIIEYITRKGIAQRRIRGIAFGETKPINKCVNDVDCTEEEYLKNRRTTFKLIN